MGSLAPTTEFAPAGWLVDGVTELGPLVRQLVPRLLPAYVRIFHRPDQGLPDDDDPPSWAEAARRNGTVLHPEAQWRPLRGMAPDPTAIYNEVVEGTMPLEGSLDRLTLPRLSEVLAAHTATPELCHAAVWHGFGTAPSSWSEFPTFHLPARDHWLFAPIPLTEIPTLAVELAVAGAEEQASQPGGIQGLTVLGRLPRPDDSERWARWLRDSGAVQSPTWWWPEDRAWVVHSEIDFDSTLVGGTTALRDELVTHPDIECLEVGPDVSLAYGADTVNAR